MIILAAAMILAASAGVNARVEPEVKAVNGPDGSKLVVDGQDFMVFGMNWDYFPIGTNYLYSLWAQPEDFIQEVLDRDMPMLRDMGVNVIRVNAEDRFLKGLKGVSDPEQKRKIIGNLFIDIF